MWPPRDCSSWTHHLSSRRLHEEATQSDNEVQFWVPVDDIGENASQTSGEGPQIETGIPHVTCVAHASYSCSYLPEATKEEVTSVEHAAEDVTSSEYSRLVEPDFEPTDSTTDEEGVDSDGDTGSPSMFALHTNIESKPTSTHSDPLSAAESGQLSGAEDKEAEPTLHVADGLAQVITPPYTIVQGT